MTAMLLYEVGKVGSHGWLTKFFTWEPKKYNTEKWVLLKKLSELSTPGQHTFCWQGTKG